MPSAQLKAELLALSKRERDRSLLEFVDQGPSWEPRVLLLLDLGANPRVANSRGESALGKACATHGSERIVKALLDRGAQPNVADQNGDTPLIWAAYYGSVKNGRALLAAGAKPNTTNAEGVTALISAMAGARYNPACLEVVPVLLKAGADPSIIAHSGSRANTSCTQFACEIGAVATLKHLLEARSPVDAQNLQRALSWASQQLDIGCGLATLLVAHGAAVPPALHEQIAKLSPRVAAAFAKALGPATGRRKPAKPTKREGTRRKVPAKRSKASLRKRTQ